MTKNNSKKRLTLLIFFMLILLTIGFIILCNAFRESPLNAMENTLSEPKSAPIAKTKVKKTDAGLLRKKCLSIYQKNKDLLVLVNKQQALPESYTPLLTSISQGRLQASSQLYDNLKKMLADAADAGHQYWLASAYRSRERQQQLIDNDIQAYMKKGMTYLEAQEETYKETQPAGHSEHETGLALDILCSENPDMTISQEQEPGNIWLQKNCWKYGFLLRYPREKESITEISYEPWHFRYVGKKAAKFLYKHNLSLEEFHEIIK